MDIHAKLDELRAKPEHVRKQYAFWSAFAMTAVVFTVWLTSFSTFAIVPHSSPSNVAAAGAGVPAIRSTGPSPASSFVAAVGSFFVDVKNIVFTPRTVVYSQVEIKPGKR